MKIGVRAHDYGRHEIEAFAELLHTEGYDGAQLALPKAFSGIKRYEDITAGHLERIRRAFEKWGIEIPVYGCYMDLGNPDPVIREHAVRTLKKSLAYSKETGAQLVGTETAYLHLNKSEKAQWYPYMLDSIKRVVDEAARLDAKLAIEPVYWHPLDSMEAVLDVMEQVGDPQHLRMIFDPSNLLQFPAETDQREYWKEWLRCTGRYIEVIHIKDFYLDKNSVYCPVPLGKGVIQYDVISQWLREHRPDLYLLREEMDPQYAYADIEFMKNL